MGLAPTGLFLVTVFGFLLGALMLIPQRRAGLPGSTAAVCVAVVGATAELAAYGMVASWWPAALGLAASNIGLCVAALLFWEALGRVLDRPVPRPVLAVLVGGFVLVYVTLLAAGAGTQLRIVVFSALGALLFALMALGLPRGRGASTPYGVRVVGLTLTAGALAHVLRVVVYATGIDRVDSLGDPTPWNTAFIGLLSLTGPALLIGLALIGQQRLVNDQTRLAATDFVTGTMSRRAWLEAIGRARRDGCAEIAVLFVDLDHFKEVNDRIGHAGGDLMLRHVAAVLRAQLAENELLGRFGGEEFVVAVPGDASDRARALGEQALRTLGRDRLRYEGVVLGATFSAGVAVWRPGEPVEDALRRADTAMYAAKTAGRGRIVVAA